MGFNKFHVDHIKEFFDEKTAATIYKELDSLQYELISQERHGHYGHVFKSEDPNMPDDSESYAAKFNLEQTFKKTDTELGKLKKTVQKTKHYFKD